MITCGIGQLADCGMPSFDEATARVFRKIAEPATEVQVGRMDETKLSHVEITPELDLIAIGKCSDGEDSNCRAAAARFSFGVCF